MTNQIYSGYVQGVIRRYIRHIDRGKRTMEKRINIRNTNGRLKSPDNRIREQDRLESRLKNIKRKLTKLRSADRREDINDKRGAE